MPHYVQKYFIGGRGGGGVELRNLCSLSDVPRVKEWGRTKWQVMYYVRKREETAYIRM